MEGFTIPADEPGLSIMPGQVSPPDVRQIGIQAIGGDIVSGQAASQGNFGRDVYMPVCIYNFLQPARLLAKSKTSLYNPLRGTH